MPPGTKQYPGGEFVAIVDTFSDAELESGLGAVRTENRRGYNQQLPPTPRGIYIGGESGSVYDLFVKTSTGSVIPLYNMVPGVVHPLFPFTEVVNDTTAGRRTTAINLLIVY